MYMEVMASFACTKAYFVHMFNLLSHAAIRVCHCDGSWGPVHCESSVELVKELVQCIHACTCNQTYAFQLNISDSEQSLAVVLDVPPHSITNNERLEILQTAYMDQRMKGITAPFVEVFAHALLFHGTVKISSL